MQRHRGETATPHDTFVFHMHRSATVAGFSVGERPPRAGQSEQRAQHEQEQQGDADSLPPPLFHLKCNVFVDFQFGFLHPSRRPFSHCSTGSITRTSTPNALAVITSGHCARPHAMPDAAATQTDAAVVRPFIESSVGPRTIVPAPRNPIPVTIPWMTRDVESLTLPSV